MINSTASYYIKFVDTRKKQKDFSCTRTGIIVDDMGGSIYRQGSMEKLFAQNI